MKRNLSKRILAILLGALLIAQSTLLVVFAIAPVNPHENEVTARYVCVSEFTEEGEPASFAFSDTRNEYALAFYVNGGDYTLTEDVSDLMLLLNDAVLTLGDGGAFHEFYMSGDSAIYYDGYSEGCVLDAPACEATAANEVAAFYMNDANLAPYVLFITGDATLDDMHNHGAYAYINVGEGAYFTIDTILDAESTDVFGDVFIKAPEEGDPHGFNIQDHLFVGENGSITADEGQILELRDGCSGEGMPLYLFPDYENEFYEDPDNLDCRTFQYVITESFEGFVIQEERPEGGFAFVRFDENCIEEISAQIGTDGYFYSQSPTHIEYPAKDDPNQSISLCVRVKEEALDDFRGLIVNYYDFRDPIFVSPQNLSGDGSNVFYYTITDFSVPCDVELCTDKNTPFPGEYLLHYDRANDARAEYAGETVWDNTVYAMPEGDSFTFTLIPPENYDYVLHVTYSVNGGKPLEAAESDGDYTVTISRSDLVQARLVLDVWWCDENYEFDHIEIGENQFVLDINSDGAGYAWLESDADEFFFFNGRCRALIDKSTLDLTFSVDAGPEIVSFDGRMVYPGDGAEYDAENGTFTLYCDFSEDENNWHNLSFAFPRPREYRINYDQNSVSPVVECDGEFDYPGDNEPMWISPDAETFTLSWQFLNEDAENRFRGLVINYRDEEGGREPIYVYADEITNNAYSLDDLSAGFNIEIITYARAFPGEYAVFYDSGVPGYCETPPYVEVNGTPVASYFNYPLPENTDELNFLLRPSPEVENPHVYVSINYASGVLEPEYDPNLDAYTFSISLEDLEDYDRGYGYEFWVDWSEAEFLYRHNSYNSNTEFLLNCDSSGDGYATLIGDYPYHAYGSRANVVLPQDIDGLDFSVSFTSESAALNGVFLDGMRLYPDGAASFDPETSVLHLPFTFEEGSNTSKDLRFEFSGGYDPGPMSPQYRFRNIPYGYTVCVNDGYNVFTPADYSPNYDYPQDSEGVTITLAQTSEYATSPLKGVLLYYGDGEIVSVPASDLVNGSFTLTDFSRYVEIDVVAGEYAVFSGEYRVSYSTYTGAGVYEGETRLDPSFTYALPADGGELILKLVPPEDEEDVEITVSVNYHEDVAVEEENGEYLFRFRPDEADLARGVDISVYWSQAERSYRNIFYDGNNECICDIYANVGGRAVIDPVIRDLSYRDAFRAIIDKNVKQLSFLVTPDEGAAFTGFSFRGEYYTPESEGVDYDPGTGELIFTPTEPLDGWLSFVFNFFVPTPLGAYVYYDANEMDVRLDTAQSGESPVIPEGELVGYPENAESMTFIFTLVNDEEFRGLAIYRYDQDHENFSETLIRKTDLEKYQNIYYYTLTSFDKICEIVPVVGGFMPFPGQFYADYDALHGAQVFLNGSLVQNWGFCDFTAGSPLNFTLVCPEGVTAPYLVVLEGMSLEEPIDLTSDAADLSFTYTPENDQGFFIHVYWTEEAMDYHTLFCDYMEKDLRINSGEHLSVTVTDENAVRQASYYEWMRVITDARAETLEIRITPDEGYTVTSVNIDGTVLDLTNPDNGYDASTGIFTLDLSITHPNMSFIEFSCESTGAGTVLYGDTDGSGVIDIGDVMILAKFVAGWNLGDSFVNQNADCDASGAIDIGDVMQLAKFVAGWNVTLGPQA